MGIGGRGKEGGEEVGEGGRADGGDGCALHSLVVEVGVGAALTTHNPKRQPVLLVQHQLAGGGVFGVNKLAIACLSRIQDGNTRRVTVHSCTVRSYESQTRVVHRMRRRVRRERQCFTVGLEGCALLRCNHRSCASRSSLSPSDGPNGGTWGLDSLT